MTRHQVAKDEVTPFTVLLLFDQRSRTVYRPKLLEMLHGTGARLEEVDATPSTVQTVAEKFDALVPMADVILVDATFHNTNVGMEIGRHMLHRDHRLVLFQCDAEEFSPAKIPFYLRGYTCRQLKPNGDVKSLPNVDLRDDILRIGMRHAAEPLERFATGPVDDADALREFADYDYVLKSPAASFFFGEFAVTVGHPALYLPLPLYVYVGIKKSKSNDQVTIRYKQGAGQHPPWVNLDVKYRLQMEEAIRLLAPSTPPLEIAVWSQAPTMCGIGTSSAIAACLARYLHREGFIQTEGEAKAADLPENENLLGPSGLLDKVFRTAWKLDLCFHSVKGSGAGSFATLAGAAGPNPVMFLSGARKMWESDIGNHGWALGATLREAYAAIDSILCWGFRLSPPSPSVAFKPTHFALLYTGATKSTGHAMDSLSAMSRYFLESPRMVRGIVESIRTLPAQVRYEVQSRLSDSYVRLLDESLSGVHAGPDITREHSAVTQEALLTAYGAATMLGMNSYWSRNDFSYLALMETCQSLLEVLGVTGITPHGKPTTWEPYVLAQIINCTQAPDGSRVFGAKVTGGGMGGDLFVSSRCEDGQEFERHLRHAIHRAREGFTSDYKEDFARVHFSSTWLSEYPNLYECQGTHFLRSGS